MPFIVETNDGLGRIEIGRSGEVTATSIVDQSVTLSAQRTRDQKRAATKHHDQASPAHV